MIKYSQKYSALWPILVLAIIVAPILNPGVVVAKSNSVTNHCPSRCCCGCQANVDHSKNQKDQSGCNCQIEKTPIERPYQAEAVSFNSNIQLPSEALYDTELFETTTQFIPGYAEIVDKESPPLFKIHSSYLI